MRKFIYKREFEFIIKEYKIPENIRNSIIESLFRNISITDKRSQYYLTKEITTEHLLQKKLLKLNLDDNWTGAISSLFRITDDLEMPLEIKNKILNNEDIAVFIGAGVSKLIGYPLWDELANSSIDFLLENKKINHFEAEKLKTEIKDPKQKLSIFDKLCSRHTQEGKTFYENEFNIKNKNKENNEKKNPYDYLVSPEFNFIKISSNIDHEFKIANDKVLEKLQNNELNISQIKKIKKTEIIKKDFDINKISKDKIYQIHGEITNISETIFTTEDYINHYYKEDSNLRKFLKEIFNKYTVIFIGYGLEEFPILETIMNKRDKSELSFHYALIPTYLNEINLFNIKWEYYKTLNINAIPYYLDTDGHYRLNKVLAKWEESIKNERTKVFYNNIKIIDEVL